jgi:NADPH-dependent curcumin reductase CurA
VKFESKEWHTWTFDVDSLALQTVQNPGIPWPSFINVLGISGLTAFAGLEAFASAQAGETMYVSAAAGSVGSMVAQFAKLKGLKVIGSAGSDEKVKWLTQRVGTRSCV